MSHILGPKMAGKFADWYFGEPPVFLASAYQKACVSAAKVVIRELRSDINCYIDYDRAAVPNLIVSVLAGPDNELECKVKVNLPEYCDGMSPEDAAGFASALRKIAASIERRAKQSLRATAVASPADRTGTPADE